MHFQSAGVAGWGLRSSREQLDASGAHSLMLTISSAKILRTSPGPVQPAVSLLPLYLAVDTVFLMQHQV